MEYFDKALNDFVSDVAYGDAIRRLADLGMTVKEIKLAIDYPVSEERIGQYVWKHFIDNGVIMLEKPDDKEFVRYEYVKDTNSLGKVSFRRVPVCSKVDNREYILLEFGKMLYKNPKEFEFKLQGLESKDRQYVEGLPWPLQPVYHVKDERIERIVKHFATI